MNTVNLKPQFAIIIPVYNRSKKLYRALCSVKEQTYKDFQAVVVDDGSTQDLKTVYKAAVGRDPRFFFHRLRHKTGVSAARNLGVAKTTAPYIAFLDSDDQWLPQKLSVVAKQLKLHKEIVFVESKERWIRKGKLVVIPKKYRKGSGDVFFKSLQGCIIAPSSTVIRRDLFLQAGGFDENLLVCEDYALWLRVASLAKLHFIPQELGIRYEGEGDQLSHQHHSIDRFRLVGIKECQKYLSKIEKIVLHGKPRFFEKNQTEKPRKLATDILRKMHSDGIIPLSTDRKIVAFIAERKSALAKEYRKKAGILANGALKRRKWLHWIFYRYKAILS